MDKPMIGIRQADGSFYEILDESQPGHKRVVLSAARTDQPGARIDLYRSVGGQIDPSGALGSIVFEDAPEIGSQEITLRLDIDAEGRLDAAAQLPGQSPRTLSVDLTPFRGPRSDNEILDDQTLASVDLDTLDDDFVLDVDAAGTDPLGFDLPDLDTSDEDLGMQEQRSDAALLADESLESIDVDTLDDEFSLDDDLGSPSASADQPMDDLVFDAPSEPAVTTAAPESFDLGDLDEGFGSDPVPAAAEDLDTGEAEPWEKISLDDMESMEFMDTGAEISSPQISSATKEDADELVEDFRMDDDPVLDMEDLDSDLSALPDLGDFDSPSGTEDPTQGSIGDHDFDQDFMATSSTEDTAQSWDEPGVDEAPLSTASSKPGKPAKAPKTSKAPKRSKPSRPAGPVAAAPQGVDRTALFLSLATLSLLVLLILVLLFLNMLKAPPAPVIQPEVRLWNPGSALTPARPPGVAEVDLGSSSGVSFTAQSILEIPDTLRAARVSLRLAPGETVADAERRFGPAARVEGDRLFW